MQKDKINIITNTTVKAIVTDKLKELTHKTFVIKLKEFEQKRDQILLQKQFYTEKYKDDINQLNMTLVKLNNLEKEVASKIAQYNERIQQIFKWVNGQEIVQSQVQTITEVHEGDIFTNAVSKEIIIKDGVVVEIRSAGGLSVE